MRLRRFAALGISLVTWLSAWPQPAIAAPAAAAFSQPAPPLATADLARANALQSGLQLIAPQTESIWPGYRLTQIPLVFHERGRIAYLFHYPGPLPAGYAALPGLAGVAVSTDRPTYASGIDTGLAIGNFTAVSVELSADRALMQAVLTGVHEAFHYYQQKRSKAFFNHGSTAMREVETARDLALAEIEQRLLADALSAADPAKRTSLAKQFLAVRHERHQVLSQDSAGSERALEAVEGTARYVERHAQILAAKGMPAPALDGLGRPAETVLAEMVQHLRIPLTAELYARSRYYLTGSGIGFLLDRWSASWQAQVEGGRPLTDVLATACGYMPNDQPDLLKQALDRFDLAANIARHQTVIDQRTHQRTNSVERFWNSPDHRIEVVIGFQRLKGYSFNPVGLVMLDDDSALLGAGSVVSAEEGGISLHIRDEVYTGIAEPPAHRLVFFVDPTTLFLSVDGKPLPIANGQMRGTISLTAPTASLHGEKATMTIDGRLIRIDF